MLRLDDILNRENKIISTKKPRKIDNIKGNIIFRNVSFSYDNKSKSLNLINLKIKAKENLVLVGK